MIYKYPDFIYPKNSKVIITQKVTAQVFKYIFKVHKWTMEKLTATVYTGNVDSIEK